MSSSKRILDFNVEYENLKPSLSKKRKIAYSLCSKVINFEESHIYEHNDEIQYQQCIDILLLQPYELGMDVIKLISEFHLGFFVYRCDYCYREESGLKNFFVERKTAIYYNIETYYTRCCVHEEKFVCAECRQYGYVCTIENNSSTEIDRIHYDPNSRG